MEARGGGAETDAESKRGDSPVALAAGGAEQPGAGSCFREIGTPSACCHQADTVPNRDGTSAEEGKEEEEGGGGRREGRGVERGEEGGGRGEEKKGVKKGER